MAFSGFGVSRQTTPVVPESVRQFVGRYIHAIDALEILLLIRREALRDWESQVISVELSLDRNAVESRLEQFAFAGFLKTESSEGGCKYRYEPSTPELSRAVDEFAHWYWSYPVAIIGLVFSRRP